MSQRTGIILVVLVIGMAIGGGGGFLYYNPQVTKLETNITSLHDTYNETITGYDVLRNDFDTLSEDYDLLDSNYEALEAATQMLQNQYDTSIEQLTNLQESVATIQIDYLELQGEYSNLQEDYSDLQGDYHTLEDNYDDLQDDYSSVVADYNYLYSRYGSLSTSFDNACYYIDRMSEGLSDYFDYVDSYIYHDESISRILTWDNVVEVSPKVWEITGGSTDLWDSIEKIYDWIDDNIIYCYDPPIPYLRPLGTTSFEGYDVYTSFVLDEWQDYKQSLRFSLDYKQGDCDDQAFLAYAMIKYYMKQIYGHEYTLYLMRTTLGGSAGHVSLLLPVSDGKITIIDPVGDDFGSFLSFIIGPGRGYLTQNVGLFGSSITSKSAYDELNNYSDRYSSIGGITYIKLYNVDVDDGSYSITYEGTISQIATQLGD